MGGHSIGIIPMAISLCASFNSAYMILGEKYFNDSYGHFYMILGEMYWQILVKNNTKVLPSS